MNIQSAFIIFVLGVSLIGTHSFPISDEDDSNEIDIYPLSDELTIDGNDHDDELGDYFEGDMILNDVQIRALNGDPQLGRTGRINTRYRWNTTIAYELDPGFTTIQMAHIMLGMAEIEAGTCLTFKPKIETDDDYIFFNSDATGCSSTVGRQGGRNRVSLKPNKPGSGCFKPGTIVHEIIHALGFYHMQSASDRDEYVEIIWENIIPGKEHNFRYYDDSLITHFGIPYDYDSVMHYSMTAFTDNGNYTIVPLKSGANDIGQRLAMTESDIARINAMYCTPTEPETTLQPETTLGTETDPEPEPEPEPELFEPELENPLTFDFNIEDIF